VRIYAGEFLFDLGSPDVAMAALKRAAALSSDSAFDDARFNLIFVSQDGWQRLSDGERRNLQQVIEAIRQTLVGKPQTSDLLNKLTNR
jgi:hypothetical protein